jgi:hypothetical protein
MAAFLVGSALATAGISSEPSTKSASIASETQAGTVKKGKDPNEKVCETHQVLGSRLATRRVCATRAEWKERRQRERDIIDRTQTQRCAVNPATDLCG